MKTKTKSPKPRNPVRDRFNRIMDLVVDDYRGSRVLCVERADNDDERLIWLTREVAAVGECAVVAVQGVKPQRDENARELQKTLLGIAGFCLAWLTPGGAIKRAAEDIYFERTRQHTLYLAGKLTFTCASPVVDPRRKFRVLLEELGEVARAVDNLERRATADTRAQLHEEIIQVAAVCVAWLESFDAAGSARGPRADSGGQPESSTHHNGSRSFRRAAENRPRAAGAPPR